jgi:hypothetical protein
MDPDYSGPGFEKMVVAYDSDRINWKVAFESSFCKSLSLRGVRCIREIDIQKPTDEYSANDWLATVRGTEADGFIYVQERSNKLVRTYSNSSIELQLDIFLFDIRTDKKVYISQVYQSGNVLAVGGIDGLATSIARTYVNELSAKRLIR